MENNYDEDVVEDGPPLVSYGTPLDPIQQDAVPRKKPIPIEEQIVTDENGRRRFHGAFTGGFSAGYYNTAGSRDGWSPAHFKSSRALRNEAKDQKPTDFMDGEDLGEFGFAPQGLKTSAQFRQVQQQPTTAATGERKRKLDSGDTEATGPIPGEPVLGQIFKPVTETIGTRLLRKMGWRDGQGIGPRLSRRQKTRQIAAEHRMYGSSTAARKEKEDDNDSSEETDPKYRDFLFAPDDIPDFVTQPKDNLFGIGYTGLSRSSVLGSAGHINLFEPSVLQLRDKKNKAVRIRGQAFGVGAYEEEDEDIYGRDDMSRYDFELDSGNSTIANDRRTRKSRWGDAKEAGAEMEKVIEGFSRASVTTDVKSTFPVPVLPKNFQPKFARKSRFEAPKEEMLRTTNPTPAQRQRALGDAVPEGAFKEPTRSDEQLQRLLSSGMIHETATKMSSFQPFARNEEKQQRYEKYLVCVKNDRRDALHLLQPTTMTEWEREREKVEFERAALLYKPLSGSMNSKFVSAGSSEDVVSDKLSGETQEKDEVRDAKKAAQMKLYGRLTHEKVEWHPANILCIRFNVKHPYGDHSVVGVRNKEASSGKFELFDFMNRPITAETNEVENNVEDADQKFQISDQNVEQPTSISTVANKGAEEIPSIEAIPEKPPIDLFKSIFLDDSSSEDEDSEVAREASTPKSTVFGTELSTSSAPKPWEEKKENLLRNKAPAQGIFANVDFEALKQRKKPLTAAAKPDDKDKVVDKVVDKEAPPPTGGTRHPADQGLGRRRAADFLVANEEEEEEEEEQCFGPAKPEILSTIVSVATGGDDDESEENMEWSEKKTTSSKKKKRHSLKKSKKKHKSKHKKKKSKKVSKKEKKRNSSSSSDDSDTD